MTASHSPANGLVIERLPGEPISAYKALSVYARLGRLRSLNTLAEELNRSVGHLRNLHGEWNWQERVTWWDQQIEMKAQREASHAYAGEIKEYQRRYRDTGRALHTVATQILMTLRDRMRDPVWLERMEINPSTLRSIIETFQVAASLEAQSLNLAKVFDLLESDEKEPAVGQPSV